MKKETNNNTCQYPSTFDELVDDMEDHPDRYKHLQIMLYHKIDHHPHLGDKYLVVNENGFNVCQLKDLEYSDGKIFLTLINTNTCNMEKIAVNVNEKHPKLFLINWKDVEDMVYVESICYDTNDELLE
jgi:hypothetical protein